jgi:tetratricopeptide (TPR) repeat protein
MTTPPPNVDQNNDSGANLNSTGDGNSVAGRDIHNHYYAGSLPTSQHRESEQQSFLSPNPENDQPSDVYVEVKRFYEAFDSKNWTLAQTILNQVGRSTHKPAGFDLKALQLELEKAIKLSNRDKEYEVVYRSAKARHNNFILVWEALERFWEKFGFYDPENLAKFKDIAIQEYLRRAQERPSDDFDGQLADYKTVLRLKPDFAEEYDKLTQGFADTYYERGFQNTLEERYDQAILDFTQAVQFNPRHKLAYLARGNAYEEKEKYDYAILDFTNVIHIDPEFREGYFSRGRVYLKKSRNLKGYQDYLNGFFRPLFTILPIAWRIIQATNALSR